MCASRVPEVKNNEQLRMTEKPIAIKQHSLLLGHSTMLQDENVESQRYI